MAILQNIKQRYVLIIIFLIAILIRALYLYLYSQLPDWEQLTVDNFYHHNWAVSIMSGNIFGDTTYFRAPFYIYCLALMYKLFSVSLWTARIFGITIGALSIVYTYLIANKMFSNKTAILAAALQMILPMVLYFEGELLLDPLFMLLLQITCYCFILWNEQKNPSHGFSCGIFLGLAIITRPTALIFIPIVLIYFYRNKIFNKSFKYILPFFIGILIIVGSIFIRNLTIAGDPVIVSSQGGINLYIGNNELADGVSARLEEPLGTNWRVSQISLIAEKELGEKLSPGEISSYWTTKAIDWIYENPGSFFKLYLTKLYYNFSNLEIANNRSLATFVNKIPLLKYNFFNFALIFALATIGIVHSIRKNKYTQIILLSIVIYLLATSLFFFTSRFRLPLMPFYIIFASSGIFYLLESWKNNPKRKLFITSLGLTAGLFSFFPIVQPEAKPPTSHEMSTGLHYFNLGDYDTALNYFHRARNYDSTYPEINLNIGSCFFINAMADSATFYYNEEIKHNPQRHKAYINLASLSYLNDNYDSAIFFAQQSINLYPYDLKSNTLLLRSIIARDTSNTSLIQAYLDTTITNSNNDLYFLTDAGKLLFENSKYELSEEILYRATMAVPPPFETDGEAFERYFRNSPANFQKKRSEAFYQLGFVQGIKQKFDLSINNSAKAIELDSSFVEAYVNLISGYISTGQNDKAASILELANQKFPGNQYLKNFQ